MLPIGLDFKDDKRLDGQKLKNTFIINIIFVPLLNFFLMC